MKFKFAFLFIISVLFYSFSQEPDFKDFLNLPKGVNTNISLSGEQLKYVNEITALMNKNDFTFLSRKDKFHWAGLEKNNRVIYYRLFDSTNNFNFKGIINLKTGNITLLSGVEYKNSSKEDSIMKTVDKALYYLDNIMKNAEIFPEKKAALKENTEEYPDKNQSDENEPAVEENITPEEEKDSGENVISDESTAEEQAIIDENNLSETDNQDNMPSENEETANPLLKLISGNNRFAKGESVHSREDAKRMEEITEAQYPFAIIVSCSDSRVPPEIIFDQGLGDLFVVRTAGEAVNELELGSIEYAVEHLKVKFILVLGHERCGAVKATVDGGEASGSIGSIVEWIQPAVDKAKEMEGDLLDNAIMENIKNVIEKIKTSPIAEEYESEGELEIYGGYYDLDTGIVNMIENEGK